MTSYLIRINGALPAAALDGLATIGDVRPAGTVIEIDLADDAALAGLLDALRTAGVELLEVHRHAPAPWAQGTPVDPDPEHDVPG